MKRFILSVLCVSVFFTGLGVLVEKSSATFKSDERALELLKRARQAVGGEAAIGNVRSMTIAGKVTKTFEIEGAARTENGDVEINFELPNKMSRKINFGSGDGNVLVDKRVEVSVLRQVEGDNLQFKTEDGEGNRKFTIVKKDGTSEDVRIDGRTPIVIRKIDGDSTATADGNSAEVDGKNVVIRRADAMVEGEKMRSNELFRMTLGLLLSAPEGTDVTYTYAGEGSVDGALCDIIAAGDGGSTIKLYLDRSTSLPRMMTFQGPKPFMIFMRKPDDKTPTPEGETRVFTRRLEAPEMTEFQVKFSDYRAVNGLQLPFKWTQTSGGKADEVIDITAYEINPANIAEKLKEVPARTFVRVKKDQ